MSTQRLALVRHQRVVSGGASRRTPGAAALAPGLTTLQRMIGNQAVGQLLRARHEAPVPATPALRLDPREAASSVAEVQQTIGNLRDSFFAASPITWKTSRVDVQRETVAATTEKLNAVRLWHQYISAREQLLAKITEYDSFVGTGDLVAAYRAQSRLPPAIEGFIDSLKPNVALINDPENLKAGQVAIESLREWLSQIEVNRAKVDASKSEVDMLTTDRKGG